MAAAQASQAEVLARAQEICGEAEEKAAEADRRADRADERAAKAEAELKVGCRALPLPLGTECDGRQVTVERISTTYMAAHLDR